MADELPWTDEQTTGLFMACIDRDAEKITDWFRNHVTTPRHEFTIVFSMASWCRVLAEAAGIVDDTSTVLPHASPDAGPAERGFAQMVSAALNDDQDMLAAHVRAYMDAPMRVQAETVVELVGFISFLGKLAADKNSPPAPEGEPNP